MRSLRRSLISSLVLSALASLASQAHAAQPPDVPKFTFKGKKFFPIGVYNYAVAGGASSQSVAALKEMGAAGINTLIQYDRGGGWEASQPIVTPAFLTTAETYGIAIVDSLYTYDLQNTDWIGMPSMFYAGSPFANQINALKGHANLLAWESFDEAPGYVKYGGPNETTLKQGHDFVKSLDPNHPIMLNFHPVSSTADRDTMRPYAPAGDALSSDWYAIDTWSSPPWPLEGPARNMDYLYQLADADGIAPFTPAKPIYMIQQGWPYSGAPGLKELRSVAYRSLIRNAAANFWWGTYQLTPADALWNNVKRVAGELRDLQPVIENGYILGVGRTDLATGTVYSSEHLALGNSGLEGITYWVVGADGHIDTYAIISNTSGATTVTSTVAVGGWNAARNGGYTRVLFETDSAGNNRAMIPVTGNTWTDTWGPWEVHVYTDRQRYNVAKDFDGDGVADTVNFDPNSGELIVTYSFTGKKIWFNAGQAGEARAVDVDNDGKSDLAILTGGTSYRIYLSTTNFTTTRNVTSNPGGVVIALTAACTANTITPYLQVNNGTWQSASSATVASGATVKFGPQAGGNGTWSWSGCGTSGSSREQTITPTATCTATAKYTNGCNLASTRAFTITVSGAPTPTPTPAPTPTPSPTPTPTPTGCSAVWSSTTAYSTGATVSYSSVNYKANYWTQGQNPSTNNGSTTSGQPWTSTGTCGATPTPAPTPVPTPTPTPAPTPTACAQWVLGKTYAVGDKVTNKGSYYQCKVAGWCSSAASAYEPGAGWAWGDAWTQLASCS